MEEAQDRNLDWQSAGYKYRQQSSTLSTGVFECNRLCKCDKRCPNRLVQLPAFVHLQVFKTADKGWGVRALHDIPKGCFISVYAGEVLTDHRADQMGPIYGDEYFAELDLLKNFEQYKEGYESEVAESAESDSSDSIIVVSEFIRTYPDSAPRSKRPHRSPSLCNGDTEGSDLTSLPPRWSFMKYFGSSSSYTINGKKVGNVGRFFNHSCSPNMFVQNVFIDTHDLRLPWIAFFASKRIRAGEEMCWDYRYTPNSVPGKVIYCNCNSSRCRGRLL
ncbi:unnamed protein product [Soboliphyme baturini]|uniref:SET domain-containing protein n=1 Tax=Soboliphyme baturini TaxID=241478 RepID=A0A183II81_9BILA|nr:unnamed protein product [Soboliphyme baturini]